MIILKYRNASIEIWLTIQNIFSYFVLGNFTMICTQAINLVEAKK